MRGWVCSSGKCLRADDAIAFIAIDEELPVPEVANNVARAVLLVLAMVLLVLLVEALGMVSVMIRGKGPVAYVAVAVTVAVETVVISMSVALAALARAGGEIPAAVTIVLVVADGTAGMVDAFSTLPT
jgi:hypothetical protein